MESNLVPIPIEHLKVSLSKFTGETGHNRTPSFITKQISANKDLEAILSWLAEFDGSPQTQLGSRDDDISDWRALHHAMEWKIIILR